MTAKARIRPDPVTQRAALRPRAPCSGHLHSAGLRVTAAAMTAVQSTAQKAFGFAFASRWAGPFAPSVSRMGPGATGVWDAPCKTRGLKARGLKTLGLKTRGLSKYAETQNLLPWVGKPNWTDLGNELKAISFYDQEV